MAKVRVILSLIAFAICQVSGQRQDIVYRDVTWTGPLPREIDPMGCSRGLPPSSDQLRLCNAFYRGATLPIAIDRYGCSRPGGVSVLEDPTGICRTYRAGAKYPIGIDRYGVSASGVMGRPVIGGPYGTGMTGTGTGAVPTGPVPTGPVYPGPGPSGPGPSGPVYQPNTFVPGGTYINGPYPSTSTGSLPIPPSTYNGPERLPPVQEVVTAAAAAKAAEAAMVQGIPVAAGTAGQSISDTFERLKQYSASALTTANPANAQAVMGRITATIDNGRHSVNNALSNAQSNPEGALNDAKNAARITLAEVERTLRENNVPEEVASAIMEKARAEVHTAIDTGVTTVNTATAANVAAKETVKTTALAKIEEVTLEADRQIAESLGNVNTQIKAVPQMVANPAKQAEIEDMLNRCRNDIAANLATAKSNPSAAAQVSRTTAHSTMNEIARMLRNENVPEEVITSIIEPNRTSVINVINEAEFKINTSVYQASTVNVRV